MKRKPPPPPTPEQRTITNAKTIMRTAGPIPTRAAATHHYLHTRTHTLTTHPDMVVVAHANARDWLALERHLRARWGLPMSLLSEARGRFVPEVPLRVTIERLDR